MTEFWTQTFCDSAGLCGWPYLWHHLARAGFHLVLVDPMMALVSIAGWTLLRERGYGADRRGWGFLTWAWLTAWVATFLREPADAGAVDWIGKSYWDGATHAVGIAAWIGVLLWIAPRLMTCRRNLRGQPFLLRGLVDR